MTSFASPLWRGLQVYQIYGANTNVGKTVVSTLLCKAAQNPTAAPTAPASARRAGFIKPVSTGPLAEADDRHIQRFAQGTLTKCLYQFKEPVSPHLAAADAKYVPKDDELVASIHNVLAAWSGSGLRHVFVETAGGVHSPGPTGTSQADLYRPLRLPVILVADSHLGGISSSISAYESLLLRGYDVESVLVFKDAYYRNSEYLLDYFGNRDIPLLALEPPPSRPTAGADGATDEASLERADEETMITYYNAVTNADHGVNEMLALLGERHVQRIDRLESMAGRAHRNIWYPFTQHKGLKPEALTVIDSARGDQFQVFQQSSPPSSKLLMPTFDGSASWWTQGLGHGDPHLALGAAYAAGRYGHVMFALGAHEPAISLAEMLLGNLENERLSRVFYSDNGSTGMEVAVKMALRASCDRYAWDASQEEVGILGLKGSYHGDTIGTMDCSEPSTFNKRVEWYRGRGFWFDFPQVKMQKGKWVVEAEGDVSEFESLGDVFQIEERSNSRLAETYRSHITKTLADLQNQGRKFGALILEPVVLGAGGMLFVDPLFQHVLIQTVRSAPNLISANASPAPSSFSSASSSSWSGVPVVFDEVFTGLYRLLHFTPSAFFPQSSRPDIVVNAKLLTGGLLPLATTTASEEIFTCFNNSPAKEQALLHGHSYTAHAVGCHVANLAVKRLMDMETDGSWNLFKDGWTSSKGVLEEAANKVKELAGAKGKTKTELWSIWPHELVVELSHAESVQSVWALGTVLTIELRDQSGGGYSSSVAQDLQQKLRFPTRLNSTALYGEDESTEGVKNVHFDVQSRVLGNVFYLMTSLTSQKQEVDVICGMLRSALI